MTDFEPEFTDRDTVRAIYDSGWDRLGDRPSITGGEPFLNPEIEGSIRYLDDCVEQINTSIHHGYAEKRDGQRGGFSAVIETSPNGNSTSG